MSAKTLDRVRRNRRRRALFRCAWIGVAAFVFVGVAGWGIGRYLGIRSVAVHGTEPVTAQEIEHAALDDIAHVWFFRKNLVGVNVSALRSALATSFPQLSRIEFEKDWLGRRLIVTVAEREAWAVWCRESVCAYTDRDGFAFAHAATTDDSHLLRINDFHGSRISLGEPAVEPGIAKIFRIFTDDAAAAGVLIPAAELLPDSSIRLSTSGGWAIILDPKTDPAVAASNLAALLAGVLKNERGRIDYVDLRLPDRAFYKLR